MRLLVFTQKIDRKDPILGFFHSWVFELSKVCESVEVICLEKGDFDFPRNVTVYSLGKEVGKSRIGYIINLYRYLNIISGSYDSVFVHMNQEYVLLAGLYWKIKNIPVYLWRNHRKGSILTVLAVGLSEKVFCTSTDSFTAKFSKTVIMPVGVDTNVFREKSVLSRKKYSICMWGRISPVKNIHIALDAIRILVSEGIQIYLTIAGPIPNKDFEYAEKLKKYISENNLSSHIDFHGPIEYKDLPDFCSSYELYLNLTESGSFDKTIMEASACGLTPVVANSSLVGVLPSVCITSNNPDNVARSIKILLNPGERAKVQNEIRRSVENQSLDTLIKRLKEEIS